MSDLKILIACPTLDLDPNPQKWLASLLVVVQDLRRANIEMGFMFPYRQEIRKADNAIFKTGIVNKYTHVLRMDDDIWGVRPGDVMKLIEADKDFISGVMYIRGFPYSRCAFNKIDKSLTLQQTEKLGGTLLTELDGDGVQPCDLTAFPFTLFKVSMIKQFTYPFFDPKDDASPDTAFCQKCLDKGIQPHVHMDIMVNHREVTPWNRLFLFNSRARELLATKQLDPTSKMYKILSEMFGEDGMKDLYQLKRGDANG